ncbi:Mitochondria fission 1 protein [Neolecta irregularis DAH-3]|uniref:Mitochondrial fission 1 protein n=1 Tax=Neolecta irregularis (strain DAH-3) TaxID=1198029 RepID=A0A1U7LWZ0_NEOID|nr:Mitochondria fission 1 protein [Neolecta irregularis DAH-3]|eukprot:OLL27031.1 Mitochondria fission 1 protein [Neolecta irregularis DAH-3]
MVKSNLPYAADAEAPLKDAELEVLERQFQKEGQFVSIQTRFNYAWGLIKSKKRQDQQEGVALLTTVYREAPERRRECLYYLALGHYKLGKYTEARRYNEILLEKEPGNMQAKSLQALIDDRVAKEGYMGMAVVGTVAAVLGGILIGSIQIVWLTYIIVFPMPSQPQCYFCHECQAEIMASELVQGRCPCGSDFLELIEENNDPRAFHYMSMAGEGTDDDEPLPGSYYPQPNRRHWETQAEEFEDIEVDSDPQHESPGRAGFGLQNIFGNRRETTPGATAAPENVLSMFENLMLSLMGNPATTNGGTARSETTVQSRQGQVQQGSPSPQVTDLASFLQQAFGNSQFAAFGNHAAGFERVFRDFRGRGEEFAWSNGTGSLDDIITQILEQTHHQSANPPAADNIIESLPKKKVDREMAASKAQCSVCRDEFEVGNVYAKLPCKHLFHTECITQWLKINGICPLCRKSVSDPPEPEATAPSSPLRVRTTPSSSSASSSIRSTRPARGFRFPGAFPTQNDYDPLE